MLKLFVGFVNYEHGEGGKGKVEEEGKASFPILANLQPLSADSDCVANMVSLHFYE